MFKTNVGPLDRALRIALGVALLAAFILVPAGGWRWLLLIGLVPLVTGLVRSCPVYSVFGMNTCPSKT